ncbi:hypothetical protein COW99_05855 [Candidatus Roizmanbacteria bacterium CG22_combo_CG10-13_8_21_14_all_38_20]|uniref:Tetratricopeptide repeat-like domain-containing protein n=1 Tax=Candidatus Roizmanbacteria bacterium CG22_combo_CG10-13_8_21_14_all_38_20 TaxID=1974862 RepID=A0A2H0BVX5_9BACT|nr:MAG: hypothetical protein COW99_05855 [Candidatus Roizmanbacteria bacterium CG22_combo_CG10-13_8_21_14_all_38_20]PJC32220.1 MAG: hypothetical protein CO050_00575 [Candidatus Roizmanbacteria bacterium CG_4_9_14_0_2_um_filter_38_17]
MKKLTIKLLFSRIALPKRFWTSITAYAIGFSLIITALWGAQRQLFPDNEELAMLRRAILIDSFSASNYIKLGEYYFVHNQPLLAQDQFKSAATLDPISARNDYTMLVKDKTNLQSNAVFWEDQLIKTSSYRDAHLKLAQIYAQLGEKTKAKEHLKLARDIDPNYPPLKGFVF